MRYEEFRDRLQDALRDVGLVFQHIGQPSETIDLSSGARHCELYIRPMSPDAEPFHIATGMVFNWSAANAARAYTCEEDLLTELLGRKQKYPKTQQRWTRVDLALHATLPYGSNTPMPDSQILGPWTSSIGEKLDKMLVEFKERAGQIVAVTGGWEDIGIESRYSPEGILLLRSIAVSGFRIVRIPRVWDDPARQRAEKNINDELSGLAGYFRRALEEWNKSVADLARWIRYSPPPPGTKPMEPWFEDEKDDEPETIH